MLSFYSRCMARARSITASEKGEQCTRVRFDFDWLALLLAVLALLVPVAASAERVPTIPLLGEPYEIEPSRGQARFLITDEGDLPPDRIVKRLDRFTLSESRHIEVPSLTWPASDVWLHFRVANASGAPGKWVVDFHRPVGTINAQAFQIDPQGAELTGDLLFECTPNSCKGAYGSAFVSGILSLDPGETRDILIRHRLGFSSQSPIRFVTPALYLSGKAQRDSWAWILNGIWIGMIALALLLYRVIGWPLAMSFAGYSLTAMLMVNISGAVINLGHLSVFAPFIEGALFQSGLILFLQFGRTFFATPRKHPVADRAMRAIMALSAFNLVVLIAGFDFPGRVVLQLLALAALTAQLSVALKALVAGWSGALPILIGTMLIVLSFMVDTANKVFGGLIHRDTVIWTGHVAFFVEAICFAVAISFAVIRIQGERDAAVHKQLAVAREKLDLVAELQTSQRRFQRARSEAERHRREFEALGHDLMQPLRTLRSAFRIRQKRGAAEEQLNDAEAAFSLLEGILAKPVVVTGEHSAEAVETFPIAAVIDNTRRMFENEANAVGIALKTVESTQTVRSDPIAVMRVAGNLVSNAIRHSRADRILLGCRLKNDMLNLEVHDDGIGMEAHELERYLARGERSRESEGRGLGLAIASSLCGNAGLRFTFESLPGRGSVFIIELPLDHSTGKLTD
ncbi:hypothetical protein J3454_06600 [Erythrobacter sp. NFXS35]|uniref:sensor histidine kinase n=1 Tax=Erythrobacter sp. NFXS35 TaxID=2818436 RepID=UPI0032DF6E3A